MKSFKQFIREEESPIFWTNVDQIHQYLNQNLGLKKNQYKINNDFSVGVNSTPIVIGDHCLVNGRLPIKFSSASSFSFDCKSQLLSLHGSPTEVYGNFTVRASRLESLEGSPWNVYDVYRVVNFSGTLSSLDGITPHCRVYRIFCDGITSLTNIHKHITQIKHLIELSSEVKSNILGLLKIKSNFSVIVSDEYEDLYRAVKILNKYMESKDILECQDEMMDAGLSQFAKL